MLRYILPFLLLASMSFSLPQFWSSFSCMTHIPTSTEQKQIHAAVNILDEYAYRERRDIPNLINRLRHHIIHADIKKQKKCILERALWEFDTNTNITLESYKHTNEYILHPYYRDTYLPNISSETKQNYIFRKWTSQKEIFLTFDDGPYNINIVNYLKQEQVAATFFLMCSRINTESIGPYIDDLFALGWHTMYHDNYDELSQSQVIADIDRCGEIFENYNLPYRIYRPAYGIINDAETQWLIKNKLTGYVWSIDSADWAWDFTLDKAREILNHTRSGDILLFHEWVDLEVFHELIEWFKIKWYSFGKL